MSNFKLISEIVSMSVVKEWEEAKKEWVIVNSYLNSSFETCLCGHYPIKEIIVLDNEKNGNRTKVGNCCINKFFEIKDFNKFFDALQQKRINSRVIKIATEKLMINERESDFLNNVWRKRKLSLKQTNWLEALKARIFSRLSEGKNYG